MGNHIRSQQETLIEALYDLALTPNNFEAFGLAWEQYLLEHQLSEHDADISENLARHFGRAFDILEKIGRDQSTKNFTVEQFVETRGAPAIALDSKGLLLAINQDAIDLLKPQLETQFASELIHVKSRDSLNRGITQTLSNDSPLPVMVLLPNGQPALMVMQRLAGCDKIIIDISGAKWNEHAEKTLKSIYKLTRRECAIAASLFQGMSINQIAEHEQRNLETLRKHTKSLLKKTQTNSQPKLMRLLTSLNFAGEDKSGPRWQNTQTNNYKLRLDDGRDIAYYDTGGSTRPAITVLHGILHDPELPPVLHQTLLSAGYRIIGVSRAWFGESSAADDDTCVIQRSTSDLISVLDALSVRSTILLGNMAGAIHAYATGSLHPNRIERIINIAGMVSLTNETQIKAMPKGMRPVVYTAKYFPKLLPLFIRTAVAMVDSGDIRKLFETMYRESPLDIEAIKNDDTFERLSRGFNYASFHGHAAYTNEGIAIVKNMGDYLEKLNCRVDLIHGRHDGATPMASVEDLSRQYKNFSISTIEDAGQLLLYTAAEKVTEKVIALIKN